MSDKPAKEDSTERISELEEEVQRLKAELEDKKEVEAEAGAVEAVRREGLTPDEEDALAAEKLGPNRSRMIFWGVLAGALALGGVLLITIMLASGFKVLGSKFASKVYPDEEHPAKMQPGDKTKGAPAKPAPKKKNDDTVQFIPPGL